MLALVATSMTMVLNLPLIIVGRCLFGLCCGILVFAGQRMLEETVPSHMTSKYGAVSISFLFGGILVALLIGIGLPSDDDTEGQKETGLWRLVYGFQYICQLFTVVLLATCFQEDSIAYRIKTSNDGEALSMIKKS